MTSNDIKKRIYSVIPVGSLHMNELLSLLNIRLSTSETNSACVTCSIKPELILNPDFVENYCKTDEHLFMLVMHELYHIILGHTKLYGNHTEIDNIAFDAIINAMLCRMFPSEEYTSFFCNVNPSNTFPGCILRPSDCGTPKEVSDLLDILYKSDTGTYYDVYQAIISRFKGCNIGLYVLLGNHNSSKVGNSIIKDVIDRIIENWPRPPKTIGGRDLGKNLEAKTIVYDKQIQQRKKMIKFLKKANVIAGSKETLNRSYEEVNTNIMSFVPNYKDRTMYAKRSIYNNVLIYNDNIRLKKPSSTSKTRTLIYLDVSGSVFNELKSFIPLLIKPYKNSECLIYTFSTKVNETNPKEVLEGKINTTLGTDINSVFEHYFSLPKAKKAKKIVILTDGYTGHCNEYYSRKIKENNIKIYVGLFTDDKSKDNLKDITKEFEEF